MDENGKPLAGACVSEFATPGRSIQVTNETYHTGRSDYSTDASEGDCCWYGAPFRTSAVCTTARG
jgi:hypothetical protein